MEALADQITDNVAASDLGGEALQVWPFLVLNPTPPCVDVYPADPFSEQTEFGALADHSDDIWFTVRARVTPADVDASQQLLLQLMDKRSDTSVKAAILTDRTLGGRVADILVGGPTGIIVYSPVGRRGLPGRVRVAHTDPPVSRILWLGQSAGRRAPATASRPGCSCPGSWRWGTSSPSPCNYGVQGMRIEAGPVTYYPSDNAWGNRTIGTYAEHFHADHVIALCDAWVLQPDEWPDDLRVAVWAPIDHYPIPPAVLAALAHEKVRPIAMARFGERLMHDCRPGAAVCAARRRPHRLQPPPRRPRRRSGPSSASPPDAFLVGMVAANTAQPFADHGRRSRRRSWRSRGSPPATRTRGCTRTPRPNPPPGSGISLEKLTLAAGCPPDRVKFPPREPLASRRARRASSRTSTRRFDVLLNPSMGEGFGIPILEAQACGVPVIASDHSAMTELTQAGLARRRATRGGTRCRTRS